MTMCAVSLRSKEKALISRGSHIIKYISQIQTLRQYSLEFKTFYHTEKAKKGVGSLHSSYLPGTLSSEVNPGSMLVRLYICLHGHKQ